MTVNSSTGGEAGFGRALDPAFIEKLAVESSKDGWWADVLKDSTLVIALRRNYLNVYWRGQSLFCVGSGQPGLKVTTHEKYLLDPKLASQVSLTDGVFDTKSLVEKGFIKDYEGKKTLVAMKKAAGLFSGLEKTGCHEIAVKNAGVIDVEIAFPGKVPRHDGSGDTQAPRVDLASLETYGDEARLVFWEAKHFSNGELRAAVGSAPVLNQVETYKTYLCKNSEAIRRSYTEVATNMVAIKAMGWKREIAPLIQEVGTAKRQLTLGAEPKVGLIVFGFDSAQRDHAGWKGHLKPLKEGIVHVVTAGDAKSIRVPTK